ncbi:MAG: hypothetical protein EHM15_09300 [Desulfobacteraceae bacterium]|nr:MAG: hypothetical protein EHM15_09300 [Desulfobacteraceae bacterium]
MDDRLTDPSRLTAHILGRLNHNGLERCGGGHPATDRLAASAVLLLLSTCRSGPGPSSEICLVLNQRSPQVRQPGDLCCPGGSVAPRVDGALARLLAWPFLPLGRWPFWRHWRRERPQAARFLALCLATALRESFEEMRLNPLGVRFLGPLPPERLELFRRRIYPLVAWTPASHRYRPNWEVQRVVSVPLRELLDPQRYVRLAVRLETPPPGPVPVKERIHPAFHLTPGAGTEILWGATYRIVANFLECVFDFTPPDLERLPQVSTRLGKAYLAGRPAGNRAS